MKNIFIFISVLFTTQTFSQDTTYIRQIGSNFYNVVKYEYENGGYTEIQTFIGDSLSLFQVNKEKFNRNGNDMAIEVKATSTFVKKINEIFRESDRIKTLTGRNPIDSLRLDTENRSHFTSKQWVVRGEVNQTIVFTYTNGGLLRYKIDANPNQTARCIGIWIIRLLDYPTTNTYTDFFMVSPDLYMTQDAKRIIRLRPQTARK